MKLEVENGQKQLHTNFFHHKGQCHLSITSINALKELAHLGQEDRLLLHILQIHHAINHKKKTPHHTFWFWIPTSLQAERKHNCTKCSQAATVSNEGSHHAWESVLHTYYINWARTYSCSIQTNFFVLMCPPHMWIWYRGRSDGISHSKTCTKGCGARTYTNTCQICGSWKLPEAIQYHCA